MFEFILDFSPMHIYIYCFGTAVQNIYDQILVIELDKVLKYGCKKKKHSGFWNWIMQVLFLI